MSILWDKLIPQSLCPDTFHTHTTPQTHTFHTYLHTSKTCKVHHRERKNIHFRLRFSLFLQGILKKIKNVYQGWPDQWSSADFKTPCTFILRDVASWFPLLMKTWWGYNNVYSRLEQHNRDKIRNQNSQEVVAMRGPPRFGYYDPGVWRTQLSEDVREKVD